MTRRLSTKYKPYEVISVVGRPGGKTSATRSESFDDEASARKRAEKVAKEKNTRSVYLRKINDNGYMESQEAIKAYTDTYEGA